jgi:hypothetical protein
MRTTLGWTAAGWLPLLAAALLAGCHSEGHDDGPPPAPAPVEATPIFSSLNTAEFEQFGFSIAPTGDLDDCGFNDFAVGAPGANSGAGVVYLVSSFDGSIIDWIDNPSGQASSQFGFSVATMVNGATTTIIVGAPYYSSGSPPHQDGIAYYFVYTALTGVTAQGTLDPPTPRNNDRFGFSVAAIGTSYIAVGEPGDNPNDFNDAGSVHVFSDPTTYITISDPSPVNADAFGYSLAAVGSNLAIGAPAANPYLVNNAGIVYVYDPATGNPLMTLPNPEPEVGDRFGQALADSGGDLLVGAPLKDAGGILNAGAAFLFDGTTGDLLQTYRNPSPSTGDQFGAAVAALGIDEVVIGAPYKDLGATMAGAVYLFDGTVIAPAAPPLRFVFGSPSPAYGDLFGYALAFDPAGYTLLIGAPLADDTGVSPANVDAGAAYGY